MQAPKPDDWYPEFGGWDVENLGGGTLRPLLAELVGASVVGSEASETVFWHGGSSHRYFDVVADKGLPTQQRGDVKSAWRHDTISLGFGGPGNRGRFDETEVDEVILVLLAAGDVVVNLELDSDGSATIHATAKPTAVYRVPAESLNALMRQDGKALARWLVAFEDLPQFLVRGNP
jgi:hypothetical protein